RNVERHAQQQCRKLALRDGTKAAFMGCDARILERAEEQVPERQIGKIVRMVSSLVMYAMALGTLKDIAQPVRCPDIPMIEKLGEAGCRESETSAGGIQAE